MSDETRAEVQRLGREEFGGASADETIQRLIAEHWEAAALRAVAECRASDPGGWAEYLAEANELADADAPVVERWQSP